MMTVEKEFKLGDRVVLVQAHEQCGTVEMDDILNIGKVYIRWDDDDSEEEVEVDDIELKE
jgi:hypothetical protein